MRQICKYGRLHGRVSPLCDNRPTFLELKNISENQGVDFGLMVGITYIESHIGVNFAPSMKCRERNNWSGKKGEKLSSGKTVWGSFPDKDGCWLYQFDNIQHFWSSFALSLWEGYFVEGCTTPECISRRWVRGDGVVKDNRSRSVRLFMKQ